MIKKYWHIFFVNAAEDASYSWKGQADGLIFIPERNMFTFPCKAGWNHAIMKELSLTFTFEVWYFLKQVQVPRLEPRKGFSWFFAIDLETLKWLQWLQFVLPNNWHPIAEKISSHFVCNASNCAAIVFYLNQSWIKNTLDISAGTIFLFKWGHRVLLHYICIIFMDMSYFIW